MLLYLCIILALINSEIEELKHYVPMSRVAGFRERGESLKMNCKIIV